MQVVGRFAVLLMRVSATVVGSAVVVVASVVAIAPNTDFAVPLFFLFLVSEILSVVPKSLGASVTCHRHARYTKRNNAEKNH